MFDGIVKTNSFTQILQKSLFLPGHSCYLYWDRLWQSYDFHVYHFLHSEGLYYFSTFLSIVVSMEWILSQLFQNEILLFKMTFKKILVAWHTQSIRRKSLMILYEPIPKRIPSDYVKEFLSKYHNNRSLNNNKYKQIKWGQCPSLICRVFTNSPRDRGSISGRVTPKDSKNGTWCLTLSIIR